MTANKETAIQKAVGQYTLTSANVDAMQAKAADAQTRLLMAKNYSTDGVKVAIQALLDQVASRYADAYKTFTDAESQAELATAADGAAYAGVQAAMLASKQTGAQESV